MTEPVPVQSEPTPEPTTGVNPIRYVVFAVLAAGFVAWVAFGYVEARVWVSGRLNVIDKPIAGMWQYLGNNLPQLPAAGAISALFWISLAFMVVGTVLGLWLFLGTDDRDPHDESWEAIHSAHLHHDSQ